MSNPLTEHRTYKLDQITTTKLEWSILFLKQLGIPAPAQRAIIARALDYYLEYLEDLNITFNFNPKHKDIRNELAEIIKLSQERPSSWYSLELPKLDLESFGHFPSYSTLAKQYHAPVKPRLPKVKKPKADTSFEFHRKKHQQTNLPDPETVTTVEAPFELTGDPESGKLVYQSKSII
jgi:hypothetical protein